MKTTHIILTFVIYMLVTKSTIKTFTSSFSPTKRHELYKMLSVRISRVFRPLFASNLAKEKRLFVFLDFKLTQILELIWNDSRLTWNPAEFDYLHHVYFPVDQLWLPDIGLLNSADGNFEIKSKNKVRISHRGEIEWRAPVNYGSSCQINVEFFPFDRQECELQFGSWTYPGSQVDLRHISQLKTDFSGMTTRAVSNSSHYQSSKQTNRFSLVNDNVGACNESFFIEHKAINAEDSEHGYYAYYSSKTWTLIRVPVRRDCKRISAPHSGTSPRLIFTLIIQRNTIFYIVNLIVPCVGLALLAIVTFLLPCESGEKVSLCISIFVSLSLYTLLLAEMIPSTSKSVPIIAEYITFTILLVGLCNIITVLVLNIHYRCMASFCLPVPDWLRQIFFLRLSKWTGLEPPHANHLKRSSCANNDPYFLQTKELKEELKMNSIISNEKEMFLNQTNFESVTSNRKINSSSKTKRSDSQLLESLQIIERHYNDSHIAHMDQEEWKHIAKVIDRISLYFFMVVMLIGWKRHL